MKENLYKATCITTNKTNTLKVGESYYIGRTFIYDDEYYVKVFTPNKIEVGVFKRNHFTVIKTEEQAKGALRALQRNYPNMETLYEDVIINTIGQDGLYALRKYHLIESCAVLNGRKLYAI